MKASYAPPSTAEILQNMRKHPYTQILNDVEITYSILCKKQQTFLFGNDRFLLLRGIQSISYARAFPQHQKLPFSHPAELPPPKATYLLSQIEHFASDQQLLTIQFSGDKKVRWEFVCPSKACAQQWRQKLEQTTQLFTQFTLSGCATHQEFFRKRELAARQRYQQQVNETNALGFNDNGSLQSEIHSRSINISSTSNRMHSQNLFQQNQAGSIAYNNFHSQLNPAKNESQTNNLMPVTNLDMKTASIITRQMSKELPHTMSYSFDGSSNQDLQYDHYQEKKGQLSYSPSSIFNNKPRNNPDSQNFSPIESFKEINRPTTVLFKGSKMVKIEDIVGDKRNDDDLRYRSLSHLTYFEKQQIKADIAKLRRNWIDQLLSGEQIVSLVVDFRNYVQRIAEIIINQLHIPKQMRMYPVFQQSKQHAAYMQEDIYLEIYYLSEEHLINKNPRYKNAVIQFKNLDYLLGVTRNQGILKVPLMMLFEYKGFIGMAKNRVQSDGKFANKQLYYALDRRQFESVSKISAQTLLDQNNCKITRYQGQASLSRVLNNSSKAYFVQKLTRFLPVQHSNNEHKLFRPEYLQDQQIDEVVFRDQTKTLKQQTMNQLIQTKICSLINILQSQKEYFTNSKELSQLIHYFGLNMRHIGLIYNKTKQTWLKRLLLDDIIARCLKNYFRFDVQNIVQQGQQKDKSKQRQQQRQANRVISFLNIIFGNTETTFRIWRNLNSYSQQNFNIKIWQNQFSDINVNYLLQAIQNHLKIVLNNNISQRKVFKSMNTFEAKDFIRFQFDSTIYNLDFSEIFQEIHQCLDEQTFDSFHNLCQTLTQQTTSKITYFEALRNHPINHKIQQFLLQFTSPHDNSQLYSRFEENALPCRLIYESKLAEIKWYLKSGKHEEANKPIAFIQKHLRKWVGEVHPLFTALNRLLAQYFLQHQLFYGTAIKYAQASLDMQLLLFGGECADLWKDYFLIGKIHFLNNRHAQSLAFLTKARSLVNIEALNEFQVYGDLCLMLAKCYFGVKYFKEAYSISKQLYKLIRNERDQRSLAYIIESVTMIKQLLDINQEHQSFERFVQSDFSQITAVFAQYPGMMSTCIKLIAIPNLKNTLLRNSKNRGILLNMIDSISKITQSTNSCINFIKTKMLEGVFPRNYQQCLKDIDEVIQQIQQNQMLQRWKSFNKMANQAILDKISGSINRGFQFMAFLTAIFNLLGPEVLSELSIMEK